MRAPASLVPCSLAVGLLLTACGESWLPTTSGMPTSSDPPATGSSGPEPTTGGGTTTTTTATTGAATDAPTTADSSGTTDDTGSVGGMCDVFQQDCPAGQKCTGYGPPGAFIPEGIKCVMEVEDPVEFEEPCIVGPEGLGDDNCKLGSVCLDLDDNGQGFCLPYCTGDSDNPACPFEGQTCVKLFFGFNFGNCFYKCDPLIQNCKDGEGCYMDATTVGNSGFVCLPVAEEGKGKTYGDTCFGWSTCEPGYGCVFPQFVPGCVNELCCTPWCDLTEVDPCAQFDPAMTCLPWYSGVTPPPGLENVGICGIQQ